jgi:hypothetical protein
MSLTRRNFCIAPLAAAAASGAAPASATPWSGPAQVRTVYLAFPKPTWPRPTIDVPQAKAEVEARLREAERKNPGVVRFSGGEMLGTMDEARAWLKALEGQDLDGIIVVPLTSQIDGISDAIGACGLPTLLFVRPYAAHAWASFSALAQKGGKAAMLASSDYDDLDVYLRIFGTIRHMRKSKVIVVVPGQGRDALAADFAKHYGTTFRFMTYADLKAAFDGVDAGQAEKAAEECVRGALRVVEPSRQDVLQGVRLYLGVKRLLERENANAITVDCLGGIRRGELPSLPCLAWSRLDDEGLYGVCQADLQCAMTQLLLTSFSGKPGFVFNPVWDSSRNEIIQSHCVAPTAMHGIGGPRSPYILRSHLETNAGLSLQVLMPVGETVTVAKFDHPRRFMVSIAEAVANVHSDSGCRTQVRTRVKDADVMLANFKGGIHRVSFYGNYVPAITRMGRLMGFEVAQEG